MKPLKKHVSRQAVDCEELGKKLWDCQSCNVTFVGKQPWSRTCFACEDALKEARLRSRPKAQMLRRTGVPQSLRGEIAWLEEPWPRDPRPRASQIDPLSWPSLVAAKPPEAPPLFTFSGCNGSGKSTRAAHLLYLLGGQGLGPLLWVSEAELLAEDKTFGPRPLMTRALEARALVVEELGSTRGSRSDVEKAFHLLMGLVDKRLTWRKPTVLTVHRALSRAGAQERGQDESESLEAVAPPIYDRLKEGIILGLENRSHRGQWAL